MFRSVITAVLVVGVVAVLTASFLPQHKSFMSEQALQAGTMSPVVVELFTSEGCSSCPPADKLLSDLDQAGGAEGVPVIALGEHVDYWDGLGWKDRFSSKDYTKRQQEVVERLRLDSAYTPQMVVDGRLEFVGNDDGALRNALKQAAQSAKPVDVRLAWNGDKLDVAATDSAKHSAEVLLVITETGLTTSVERGENGGRILHHAAVVRRIAKLGDLRDSKFSATPTVVADAGWKSENLKAVVLVQDEKTGAVLGARAIAFPRR